MSTFEVTYVPHQDGRKIPHHYEHPFDNIMIELATYFKGPLHALGVTPNQVTVASFVTSCISAILIYYNHFFYAAAFFVFSYFLDCLDGNMARTYNQVTDLGDKLDHFLDIIKTFAITTAIALHPTLPLAAKVVIGLCFTLFGFATSIHLGCQEKIYNSVVTHEPTMLGSLTGYCTHSEQVHWTKWIGTGSYVLFITAGLITFGLENKYST